MPQALTLTPALADYLLGLLEVDDGEHAPACLDLDAITDQLAAVSREA